MTKVRSSAGERFDSATFAAEIIRGAVWKGLESGPLLDIFGLHSFDRLAIGDRVPLSAMFAAWEHVMKHLRDPGLPVETGLRSSTTFSSPIAHLYQSLGTVRDALTVHARLRQIISPYGWKLQGEDDDGRLTVVLDGLDDLGLGARCHREYFVARTFSVLKAMEADVYPEVSFSHAMPDDVSAHLLAFRGGIAWERRETTLRASSASLDKVFATPMPESVAALERIIEQLRARLGPPPTFSSRAAEHVASQLRRRAPRVRDRATFENEQEGAGGSPRFRFGRCPAPRASPLESRVTPSDRTSSRQKQNAARQGWPASRRSLILNNEADMNEADMNEADMKRSAPCPLLSLCPVTAFRLGLQSSLAILLTAVVSCGGTSGDGAASNPQADAGATTDAAAPIDASEDDAAPLAQCTIPDVAITHTGTTASSPQRVLLDAQTYPDAVCNDGSPASYVIRPGSGAAASRWVVLLGGGGDCYDQASCASRASSTPTFITSNDPPAALTGDGIRSTDASLNPDFYDATQVAVPYCSSDAWSGRKSGTGTFSASDIDTWNFQGHAIVAAVFADLAANHGLSAAKEVLLTGDSAGGVGTLVNLNDVAALVPPGARYLAYGDASFGNHVDDFSATGAPPSYLDTTDTPTQESDYASGLVTWNGRGDKICDAAATTALEKLDCYLGQVLLAPGGTITMPTLVTVAQQDTVQLETAGINPNALQAGALTPAQAAYVAYFSSNMRTNLQTTNSNVSIFSPDAVLHVEQTVKNLYNVPYTFPAGQLTYQQALHAWYESPCTARRNVAN